MTLESWLILFLACCGACVIPGPNSLLVVNHVSRFGLQKTFWTIIGGVFGFMFLMTVAALGLGSVINAFPFILEAIKNIGSLYLAVLGLRLWYSEEEPVWVTGEFEKTEESILLKQGFISAITNVNAFFFFMSILPNVLNDEHSLSVQAIQCSLTLGICEFFFEFGFALLVVPLAGKGLLPVKIFNRICGGLFFIFAILLQFKQY